MQSRLKNIFTQKSDSQKEKENILEKINKAGIKFLIPLTAEETYATIVTEAVKLMKGDYGSIILMQQRKLKRVYASAPFAFMTKNRKKANTYKAFKERKIIIKSIKEMENAHPELVKIGVKITAFIPLSYKKKSIGVLTINFKKNKHFTSEELRVLKLFGSLASLAIRKTQLYTETRDALKTRDLFIAMAAHELRTPLTTINGYAQLLQKKATVDLPPYKNWIDQMVQEGIRLSQLINELLEINKIQSGKFQYIWKECHIGDILEHAVSIFKITHQNNQLYFINNAEHKNDALIGDSDKLLQVVINLLNNAVKFSSEEKPINLILESGEGTLKIVVKDQGRGIQKKDLPYIFEDFYKGNEGKTEGMGLGLFLANTIVRGHHGSISVNSKENIGTEITIILPKSKL